MTATPEQLVRAIRQEEAHIAQLRSWSATRRTYLLERLVKTVGSRSEAARLLNVSPQAVSKALTSARQEEELSDASSDASINAMDVRLTGKSRNVGWAVDVVTDAEWRAIEGLEEKRRAARQAAAAWRLRMNYTEAVADFLHCIAEGCEEVEECSEEETAAPSEIWEIVQGERLKLPANLLPNSRQQAREVGAFARALARGLSDSTSQRTYARWEDRAEDPGAEEEWRDEVEGFRRTAS